MREWLLRYIDRAFRKVSLRTGRTIYEAAFDADYGFRPSELDRAKTAERIDWRRVPVDDLFARPDAILFLDAAGHRFYTPAIMTALLRIRTDDDQLCNSFLFFVANLPDRSCLIGDDAFRMTYNRGQRAAIVKFLKFAVHCAPREFGRADALRALEAVRWCSLDRTITERTS